MNRAVALRRALRKVVAGEQVLEDAVDKYNTELFERGTLEMQISLKQMLFIHN
tara:strand:- start:5940 stop:6098 length:159 start_codon:yes stop_codon:yes gene_type:complete